MVSMDKISQVSGNPTETWNARFSGTDYIFGTAPNHYLMQHLSLLRPGMRALAVADGEGRNSVWLAQQGLQTVAFDISPVGVEKASKLAQLGQVNVQYAVSDCDAWDWTPNTYDVVAAIFVQFAAPEMRAKLFSNMVATLKPAGLLILQGYTPKQLEYKTGGPPNLDHLYSEQLLRDGFSDMEILEMQTYETILNEGAQHAGRSALIGMIARKR